MYHSLFLIFTLTIQLTCSTFNILKIVNGFILGKKMSSLSKLVKPILPTSWKYLFFLSRSFKSWLFWFFARFYFFFFFYLFSLFFLITSSFLFPSNNLIFYLSFFESCFNLNRLFHMHWQDNKTPPKSRT